MSVLRLDTLSHSAAAPQAERLGSLIGPWEKTVRPKIHYAFNR